MNDLRLLYQVDSSKKIITLEFKQITALEPLMPLLSKFEYLESLSLHGNRLKALPADMSELANLQELDISNNMLNNLSEVIASLKTLPNLTDLSINFKNQQEQVYTKNELPKLQRINKKVLQKSHNNYSNSPRKRKNHKELTEQDLQNVAVLYDEIRNIYKSSKYMVDKELADDFDRNVDIIMHELTDKNKTADSVVEEQCNSLCGKYALMDLCFVKLITYFYHFDKKIANALEKIHDEQANMFKSITDMLIEESLRSKVQITNVRTKKEDLYKAEIRRLKNYQTESSKQLEYMENKNRELLDKLIKYTKSDALESTLGRAINMARGSASKRSHSNQKQNNEKVTVKNKIKNLSIFQLKEVMHEIYESKRRHNQACFQNSQPLQTMEMHMYTYLNQKYGLKSIAVEWAMNIVNAIRRYGMDDPQVAIFGKILRNQFQQNFAHQQQTLKQSLQEGIKRFKKNVGSSLNVNEEITMNLAEEVLLYMGLKRDQISTIISRIADDKITNNCMSAETLERALLDNYMRKHDEKTGSFHKKFKLIDTDEDGIVSIEQLQKIMEDVEKTVNVGELIKLVDPSGRGTITYSSLLETLLRVPETKNYFKAAQA